MISSDQVEEGESILEKSLPPFREQTSIIGNVMKKKTKNELKSLCGVSDALASHVKKLYTDLLINDADQPFSAGKKKYNQAALMFDGPAFRGLSAKDMSNEEGMGIQKHLRILTGLYGCVKPGDLIQEHRLCMGTKLAVDNQHKDLYSFWGNDIASEIMRDVEQQLKEIEDRTRHEEVSEKLRPLIINCASQEYSKSVLPLLTDHNIRIVECVFLDGGKVKSAFAKRARGLMARFACTNHILHASDMEVDKIKQFDCEGYRFSEPQSSVNRLVFTRSPGDIPVSTQSRKRKSYEKFSDISESSPHKKPEINNSRVVHKNKN